MSQTVLVIFTWTEVIATCEVVDDFLMAEEDILTSLDAFVDMEEAAFISDDEAASNFDPESGKKNKCLCDIFLQA
jgi:hypothetical protein